MIRWTTAGAVPSPTTVQIRVQRSYPGRVRAGAPVPTRSMNTAELRANIDHFTVGLRGPRTRACDALVLSGVGVAARPDTVALVRRARDQGIGRVTLHVGPEDLPTLDTRHYTSIIDTLVVPVQPTPGALQAAAQAIVAARRAGIAVTTNTVLHTDALDRLARAADALCQARPDALTFTYPFPIAPHAPPPPAPARALDALRPAIRLLDQAGLRVHIKGLPACLLGEQAGRLRKSANRWYVDADHQQDQALLFFPDVVAFFKEDACRYCAADGDCDGFFSVYLRDDVRLRPLPRRPTDA